MWWFTTNSFSDDHLSAFKLSKVSIMLLLLLVLPTLTSSTVQAGEGLFLSPSVSFSCPSANFTPVACYLPSSCLPPYPRENTYSFPPHMYLLNPVLPNAIPSTGFNDSINSSPCFLCISVKHSQFTDLVGTTQNSDGKNCLTGWTADINSTQTEFYYSTSKEPRLCDGVMPCWRLTLCLGYLSLHVASARIQ